jgi:hypothetical protein
MKRICFWIALLMAPLAHLFAQVSAEVVLDQEQFLIGESLPAAVRIVNRSGQTLHFGEEADWLTFSVESRDKFNVVKHTEVPVEGAFVLETGKVATRRVDLAPHFSLNQIGRYQITATLKVKEWEAQVQTKPRAFDIINAARLWSQEVGVPTGAGGPPEVRRYSLEQANYLRTQLRLYLRITDAEATRVFKVLPLGQAVSFSNPEHQIDRAGHLHVFYQNGARSFSYQVINAEGEILVRQTYDYVDSRPKLKRGEDGKLLVHGGLRRETRSDLPLPNPPMTAPPPPMATNAPPEQFHAAPQTP